MDGPKFNIIITDRRQTSLTNFWNVLMINRIRQMNRQIKQIQICHLVSGPSNTRHNICFIIVQIIKDNCIIELKFAHKLKNKITNQKNKFRQSTKKEPIYEIKCMNRRKLYNGQTFTNLKTRIYNYIYKLNENAKTIQPYKNKTQSRLRQSKNKLEHNY